MNTQEKQPFPSYGQRPGTDNSLAALRRNHSADILIQTFSLRTVRLEISAVQASQPAALLLLRP